MRFKFAVTSGQFSVGSKPQEQGSSFESSVISRKLGLEVMGLISIVLGRSPIAYPDLVR